MEEYLKEAVYEELSYGGGNMNTFFERMEDGLIGLVETIEVAPGVFVVVQSENHPRFTQI